MKTVNIMSKVADQMPQSEDGIMFIMGLGLEAEDLVLCTTLALIVQNV